MLGKPCFQANVSLKDCCPDIRGINGVNYVIEQSWNVYSDIAYFTVKPCLKSAAVGNPFMLNVPDNHSTNLYSLWPEG